MRKNVGSIDRKVRLAACAAFVVMSIFAPLDPAWRAVMIGLATVAGLTAFTGF